MKRTAILTFLILTFALVGCGDAGRQGPTSSSAFMEGFAIGSNRVEWHAIRAAQILLSDTRVGDR
jgi:hypothetical protein